MFAAARSTPSPSAVKPVVWECFRLFGAERDVKNALALVRAPVSRVSSEGQCALGLLAFLPPAALHAFSTRNILCQTNKHYDFAELNNPDK